MLRQDSWAFLLDVDNTLLDNDRFARDLSARLEQDFGAAECQRYWTLYGELRQQRGYADYLGALQAFRSGCGSPSALLHMAGFMLDYPFQARLYPQALAVIDHLHKQGTTAIVSDGDVVFQPRKIQRCGLWDAVAGRVLVCLHKEREVEAILQRFPAQHYVMVDDKPLLLAALKRQLGTRLTSIFIRQGHYAEAANGQLIDPPPDLTLARIGELCRLQPADFPS